MNLIISAATHRSGSTLLQRIFNIRKKTLIWGEHNGCLTDYFNIYKKVKHYSTNLSQQRIDYFENNENPNCWIACMMPEMEYVERAIIKSIREFFNTLYCQYPGDHDCIGLKEVRYGKNELTLFKKCYPQAKIILLIRNPIDVWKSMLGIGLGQNLQLMINKWKNHASYYWILNNNYSNAHLILYEKLINKDRSTLNIISQLGEISKAEINKVLSKKILSSPKPISSEQEQMIISQCYDLMTRYGYY